MIQHIWKFSKCFSCLFFFFCLICLLERVSLCLSFPLFTFIWPVFPCVPTHTICLSIWPSIHPSHLSFCQRVQGQRHPGTAGSGQTGRLQGRRPHYGRGELSRIYLVFPPSPVVLYSCCEILILVIKVAQLISTLPRMYFNGYMYIFTFVCMCMFILSLF